MVVEGERTGGYARKIEVGERKGAGVRIPIGRKRKENRD
jgi:hypothetical protein